MTKTILLADDSVTIQKVVELTFMDGDYRVVAVGNGSDAASRLEEVQPDLVLADVHMPGLNGYDLCRRVKEWRMGTPVLLLVGTFEPFDRDEFAACGAQGHMKKPFDSQELQRQVDELLRSSAPAVAESESEPMWVLSDSEPEPEPPPLPSSSWAETASPAPSWQQPTPPAAWDAPLPVPSWQSEESSLTWEEPAAPAPAPAQSPAALVSPAATVGVETARISAVQLRGITGGGPPAVPAAAVQSGPDRPLSEADVDRIARRVVELLGDQVVRDVSWEVIPDLAEVIIKDRIRELEAQVE